MEPAFYRAILFDAVANIETLAQMQIESMAPEACEAEVEEGIDLWHTQIEQG